MATTNECAPAEYLRSRMHLLLRSNPQPSVPSYDRLTFNRLAAALYNARHAGCPLKSWDEIAANEITRNFYTAATTIALRAVFPTEGY